MLYLSIKQLHKTLFFSQTNQLDKKLYLSSKQLDKTLFSSQSHKLDKVLYLFSGELDKTLFSVVKISAGHLLENSGMKRKQIKLKGISDTWI